MGHSVADSSKALDPLNLQDWVEVNEALRNATMDGNPDL
jgi:hypothetical protein